MEATTKSGYPAWITLKDALNVPNIQDLAELDPIQLEAFRNRFQKEGEEFETERAKRLKS